jgi:hypothetical protein
MKIERLLKKARRTAAEYVKTAVLTRAPVTPRRSIASYNTRNPAAPRPALAHARPQQAKK